MQFITVLIAHIVVIIVTANLIFWHFLSPNYGFDC